MDPIARYIPKSLDETVNLDAQMEMCDWIESWATKRKIDSVKNAILLHGPSGTGKTLYARLLLKKYGYNEVLYTSTSDIRTYTRLTRKIDKFIKNRTFYSYMEESKKAIIFDELEGVGNSDKGCIKKILEILYPRNSKGGKQKMTDVIKYHVPIICITNNINDPRSNKIKKYCYNVQFTLPTAKQIDNIMLWIKKKMKVSPVSSTLCATISKRYNFDYNMLFRFIEGVRNYKKKTGKNRIKLSDIENGNLLDSGSDIQQARLLNTDMYILSRRVLNNPVTYNECFNYYNAFPSILQYIVYDNLNLEYSANKCIGDVLRNMEYMSVCNIFNKAIHDDQFWFLNDYASVLYLKTANDICMTKKIPIEKVRFSLILNKNSKTLYTHKIIKQLLDDINVDSYDLTLVGSILLEKYLRLSQNTRELEWFHETGTIQSIDKYLKFNLFKNEYESKITSKYKKTVMKLLL